MRTGSAGFQFQQSSTGTPAALTINNNNSFVVGYALGNYKFTSALKLLESFGSVRVLSSPKISVLNNQAAIMRVTDDLVYFTLQPGTTSITVSGSGTVQAPATFTTTPNVSPVGLIISVIPQISDTGTVLLDVRPTIRRQIGDVSDPNPALAAAGVDARAVPSSAAVGGGGAPGVALPSAAVSLPTSLTVPLRSGEAVRNGTAPAVVGRTESGRLLLDLRSVPPSDDGTLAAAVIAAAAAQPGGVRPAAAG